MGVPPGRREPEEIVSLTALRGCLACWVVLHHFWSDVLTLFPAADVVSPVARWGHMAVPAFFMLSGFVLAYTYTDRFASISFRQTYEFMWRRLARIYPVHIVSLVIVLAMVWASGLLGFTLSESGYGTRDFFLNVFLVQTWVPNFRLNWNYPSWSISSEWFAYLIFPVTVAGAVRLGLTRTGAAAVMAVCLLGGSVAFVLFWRPLPYYELLLVVPTFLLGVAGVWAVRDRSPVSPARARWVETALAGALIAIPFAPHPDLVVSLLLVTSFLLILALGLSRGRCHPFWKFWPIVFVGEVSYSLYMTHTLAQKILYKLLPSVRFFDSNLFTRLGVVGAYVMFIVVCCLLMYYLVERPCRARVRRATRNEGTVLDALPETSSERTMPRPDRMAAPRGSDRGIAAGVIQ